jgi:addiction module RelE/StbE family toxin
MARQIRWTNAASDDLESIVEYIATDSPAYASVVATKIVQLVEEAGESPAVGRIVPQLRMPSIRERVLYSYRIIYRVERDAIVVLGILHGAQSLPDILKARM